MQLAKLSTSFLGRNCIYYNEIDSTQSEVWRLYEKDVENGTLVMADKQTAGKGTHGRIWHTDEANNIAFSFLIKMDCNVQKLEGLTKNIAEIIVEILKENKIATTIKSPNDIILNNKKLGGILTQSKVIEENVKCLVIGIGLNINQETFPEDIVNVATSIKKETGKTIDVKTFIAEFCNRFEKQIKEKGLII